MTKEFIDLVNILLNKADKENWTDEKFMELLNKIYSNRPVRFYQCVECDKRIATKNGFLTMEHQIHSETHHPTKDITLLASVWFPL